MEGLQAFDDMMENTKVKNWYMHVERASLNHEGQSWSKNLLQETDGPQEIPAPKISITARSVIRFKMETVLWKWPPVYFQLQTYENTTDFFVLFLE